MNNKILLLLAAYLGMSQTIVADKQLNLILATEATYAPYEYMDASGKMQGFDVDVLTAICDQMAEQQNMQVHCQFEHTAWDSLIPSLKMGKYDVIFGAMAITEQRQKQVDFTIPYNYPTGSIIFKHDNGSIVSATNFEEVAQALNNKSAGTQVGTTFAEFLDAQNTKRVNTYASILDALQDFNSGRIEVVVADTPTLKAELSNAGIAANTIKQIIIGNDVYSFGDGDGFAVNKGNIELLDMINQALLTIQENGILDNLKANYF